MRNKVGYGLVAAMVLAAVFLLAGCGGGGDGVSQSTHEQLQTELDAAKADLDQAEKDADAADAADKKREQQVEDLAATITALTTALAGEGTGATGTTTDTMADATDETDAEEDAEDATTPTTPTTTPTTPTTPSVPTTQSAEASLRAMKLEEGFGGPATITMPVNSGAVTAVPTASSLMLKRSGYRDGTLSGKGLRSATMALTAGGNTGKTVVYTDRELSRSLLDHYGDMKPSATSMRLDMQDSDWSAEGVPAGITFTTGDDGTDVKAQTGSRIVSHGFSSTKSVEAQGLEIGNELTTEGTASLTESKSAASYGGSIHGVGGTYRCGTENCKVTLTATYTAPDPIPVSATRVTATLEKVLVGTEIDAANVHFSPTGPAIKLHADGPVGADGEYMIFGYWHEDPTSAFAPPRVGVFAEAIGTAPTVTALNATYDGDETAVGLYVEEDQSGPVTAHRQGEFVADVFLKFVAGEVTEGTISDFKATPTGGSSAPKTVERWVVNLVEGGTAAIQNLTGTGMGFWGHSFVPAHARALDNDPPAVTGVFNARIVDRLHLLGAFGAEKRN